MTFIKTNFDFNSIEIDFDNCTVCDKFGTKLPTKAQFVVKCLMCHEQYNAKLCFEKSKKHKWHCKSCAITKEWNENSAYRQIHVEKLKISNSTQEQKDRVSQQSIKNWRDPEIRLKMSCSDKRDRKLATKKGLKTKIQNILSGKTKLKVTHGKRCLYKSVYMRSTFEQRFAEYLDKNNLKWSYEPKSFLVCNDKTYTPDFYVDCFGYVEIKGWWRDDAKEKYEWFVLNCNEPIVLVMNCELQQLENGEITLENLFN